MSLPNAPIIRNPSATDDVQPYELLTAVGFSARERVSICTQLPGERFTASLYEVRELAGWSPPDDRNVWFGVNPVGRHVRYGRGTESDTARVRALFADLDVKPGQFNALWQCGEARLILEGILGVGPVAVIESGHGLQPIWRVGSPRGDSNVIGRDRDRDEWKDIYQRWGSVVQHAARQAIQSPWVDHERVRADLDATPIPETARALRAISIDNVFNLDRILRCPGSVNWKDPAEPVPVRTRLYEHDGKVMPRDLASGLDRDGIVPLAKVGVKRAAMPTSFGEADSWIHEQPGATLELTELLLLPAGEALGAYFDVNELVRAIGNGDGAHSTMRDKVLHAVFAAQEGRAGLAVALNNIGEAYLRVMDARASGRLDGEARDVVSASHEWAGAVRGAVAKARTRTVPDVDGWAVKLDSATSRGRYVPTYKPSYRPTYRKPWWV